ncbi:unnamed protein product [Dovyalis caffra]|uniref:Uncharacterized protein n=1 Tax=Dovyalis caffra TaxID=77055 RepID=A0AAV1R893_9ROSI|nr:unnamed protein product [Dovyalis caffra]
MQPLLTETTGSKTIQRGEGREKNSERTKTHSFGEMAGGTAAGCAAVCCCCPCTVINLLVLAVYKVPVCLCKKAKIRQRLMRKKKQKERSLLSPTGRGGSREEELEEERETVEKGECCDHHNHDGETAAADLDKEMLDQFYGTGFWRSPSQRGA